MFHSINIPHVIESPFHRASPKTCHVSTKEEVMSWLNVGKCWVLSFSVGSGALAVCQAATRYCPDSSGNSASFHNPGWHTLNHTSVLLFNLRHWLPSGWRWLGALPQTAEQSQVALEVTEVHWDRPSWAFTLVITVSHRLQFGSCLYTDIFLNLKPYLFLHSSFIKAREKSYLWK